MQLRVDDEQRDRLYGEHDSLHEHNLIILLNQEKKDSTGKQGDRPDDMEPLVL